MLPSVVTNHDVSSSDTNARTAADIVGIYISNTLKTAECPTCSNGAIDNDLRARSHSHIRNVADTKTTRAMIMATISDDARIFFNCTAGRGVGAIVEGAEVETMVGRMLVVAP